MSTAADGTIPEPFVRITKQNEFLLKEIQKPTFDGFVRLDPVRNQAITYIHAANEIIVTYPQGSFPLHLAYPMVYSSMHLLRACEKRYGRVQVKAMSQTFRKLFRLWFYAGKPRCPSALYAKKLFKSEEALISDLCTHCKCITEPPPSSRTSRDHRKGTGLHGTRTKCMLAQMEAFVEYLKAHPISDIGQGKTVNARARQFWAANKKRLECAAAASGEKHGYSDAKALASAYRASRL